MEPDGRHAWRSRSRGGSRFLCLWTPRPALSERGDPISPIVFDVSSSHASTPPLFSPYTLPPSSSTYQPTAHTHSLTHQHTLAFCLRETRHKTASGGECVAMSQNTSSNNRMWKLFRTEDKKLRAEPESFNVQTEHAFKEQKEYREKYKYCKWTSAEVEVTLCALKKI